MKKNDQQPLSDYERLQKIASALLVQMEHCNDPHKLRDLSATHANVMKSLAALAVESAQDSIYDDGFVAAMDAAAAVVFEDGIDTPMGLDD